MVYIVLAWFLVRLGEKRQAVGFVLAPLAPCLINAVVVGDIVWLVITAPFAYLFAISGAPLYFLLRRLGWLKLWQVMVASAILGVAIAFFAGFSGFDPGGIANGTNALQFAGYGAATGLTFWLIAFAGPRSNNAYMDSSRDATGTPR